MDLTDTSRLPKSLRDKIAVRDLVSGETLFVQEDTAENFYIVAAGIIKLVRYLDGGKISTFEIVRTSQSVAEIALFADIYPCTAIAEIPSRVIVYPKEELLKVLLEYPELAENFMAMLVEKIQSLKFSLELRDIRVARERVLHYLCHLVDYPKETTIVLDRPLKDIAGDLGFTPETLSRALIELETKGAIAREKKVIILHNNSAA